MPHAIVIDDDKDFQEAIQEVAEQEGFTVEAAGTLEKARSLLARRLPDLALVDLSLPDGDGFALLEQLEATPSTEVVFITGHATVRSVIEALREGASDYLTKPVDLQRLRTILANVARRCELHEEVEALRAELRGLGRFGPLIGSSPSMQTIYDMIGRVAPTEATVLIQGQSGTGKELVAQTVHQLSRRRKHSFVALNCGSVSPQLIESELFGHERGSFTGADRIHKGYFERAAGGTLFLDEVTEMPQELQIKLLRALETRHIIRIGGEQEIAVDVRVIAATNRDPDDAVRDGKLRQDLLYRLRVFPLQLPPLRERAGDVDILAEHFLSQLNRTEGTQKHFNRATLEALRAYHWPGNVRELSNAVHTAFILADVEIGPACLPASMRADGPRPDAHGTGGPVLEVRIGTSIDEAERRLILATLAACDGHKERAAHVLGISLKTLYNRLNQYKARPAPAEAAPA
jgi:two-component system, NtrC family, response regulator HydG